MTARKGALVLIKAGDGGSPEIFSTLGGLRTSGITLNNQLADSSNVATGDWRQLLNNAGIQSLRIAGHGIFTDSIAEETVWEYAFSCSIKNYRFVFAGGDYVTGAFLISTYERAGNYDGEEVYSLVLESAGAISYVAA